MYGIRRICRIIKSYKTYALQELLNQTRANLQIRKSVAESRRKTMLLKRTPISCEQRTEQSVLQLNIKIDNLTDIIERQEKTINELRYGINK